MDVGHLFRGEAVRICLRYLNLFLAVPLYMQFPQSRWKSPRQENLESFNGDQKRAKPNQKSQSKGKSKGPKPHL